MPLKVDVLFFIFSSKVDRVYLLIYVDYIVIRAVI